MIIFVNNKEIEIAKDTILSDFVQHYNNNINYGFALALNGTVINKSEFSNITLKEHDKILLIKAACGG